jgi:membrane-associated phospholipid phosphatase
MKWKWNNAWWSVVMLIQTVAVSLTWGKEPIPGAGDAIQLLIPATGYAATWLLNDTEGRTQFYWSAGTSMTLTYLLKYTIDERRPNGGHHSFPSGHTSSAFVGASFIQQRYGWRYGLPAYVAAAYTGWSRVELDAHHPHDVYAGAAVGILSSYLFTKPYNENVDVGLFYEPDTIGFQINWKW